MKTVTKRILLTVAVVFLLGVGTLVYGFFMSLRTFGIEDRIHGKFYPVSQAIDHFTETSGRPPGTLNELVPAFLVSIPTSPLVDKVEYRVVEGTNWIMNAHSRALNPARIYSWRSHWNFTDQEKTNLMKQFHNISVFRE
jgi:hypothetical protein